MGSATHGNDTVDVDSDVTLHGGTSADVHNTNPPDGVLGLDACVAPESKCIDPVANTGLMVTPIPKVVAN